MLFVVLKGLGLGVLFIIYWLIGMKDGTGKTPPETKRNKKNRKKEMTQNSKFSRRAKNYWAIRQAV